MESNRSTGPDMMKMLQMMLPYMDASTKRMMSIMMKLHELRELMEPEVRAAQPQREEPPDEERRQPEPASDPPENYRPMDDRNFGGKSDDLAAQLQEGLTPEQRSMMTSLTGMLK